MFNLKFSRSLLSLFLLIPLGASVGAAQTTVVFNPSSVSGGPFPTNALTTPDNSQVTGLRVNLQESDTCDYTKPQAVCSNFATLNTLDGFSLNPRIMVCFSGPVDPNTLQAGITISPVLNHGHTVPGVPSAPVGITQVTYDPNTNCAFGKPDSVLAQHATYLLVITDAVRSPLGKTTASSDFTNCLSASNTYCQSLQGALASSIGAPHDEHIVAASVFTTMTATAWAQAAHAAADAAQSAVSPAGETGSPSLFNISDLQSLQWNTDGAAPPTSQPIDLSVLKGVGQIAFGEFESTDYLDPATGSIALGASKNPLNPFFPIPVSFHVLLPSTPPPASGYPVLIWGHGLGDNQFGASTYLASTFAQKGFAVLTIEVTGQGFGPNSTVAVTTKNGVTYTEATPGRGVVLQQGQPIGPTDGCILVGTPIGTRDCNLQTVADLSAIVHALQTSAVQGALGIKLDPTRIYYGGQSEGGIFGTVFNAVEPGIRAAMLSAGGGTSVDIARLAISARPLADAYALQFGIANVAAGMAPPDPIFKDAFNDNYIFRNHRPVVNQIPGAPTVQAGFEAADWIQMPGDPLSFAAHLKLNPLPGVNAKPVLFLYSQGDMEVPNPTNSALIRAAGIQSTSWYLNFAEAFALGQLAALKTHNYCGMTDPHTSFSYPTIFSCPLQQSIALAEQQQAAIFLASDGRQNPNPNPFLTGLYKGIPLFTIPSSLPESLNYFQLLLPSPQ